MSDLAAAERALHRTFGFETFRPGQGDIVAAILDGRDVLAVMPTGSGKSLCYQLPALIRDGLTIVVSPLIALMRNQVAQLRGYGVTAAADAATRTDIQAKLFKRPPAVFVHGFDRPNLRLAMQAKIGGRKQVADFVKNHPGQSGIVYCASRRKTEELADFLRQNGVNALPYHAGMEPQTRSRNQDVFLQEDGVIVVATIAFGMGI